MYEDLFAVIVDGVLCESSISNTAEKAKLKFMQPILKKRWATWAGEACRGAEVKPITIQVHY